MQRQHRINQAIRAHEVRVVDEHGEQVGVMPTSRALNMAEERGLDLVEVAAGGHPPVCRLMDYGKYKYDAKRKAQPPTSTRIQEVRFRPNVAANDYNWKLENIRRLLGQGAKVKVLVVFRGREITHPDLGMSLLRGVAKELGDDALLAEAPRLLEKRLSMVLAPKAKQGPESPPPAAAVGARLPKRPSGLPPSVATAVEYGLGNAGLLSRPKM